MDFTASGATLEEGTTIPYFHFSPDAQEFFYRWLTKLQTEKLDRDGEEPIMSEHLAKFRSLMPSLALIFHLIEVADGTAAGAVTLRSAQQAAQWCDYLETHARRIYGLVNDIGIQKRQHGSLAKFRKERCKTTSPHVTSTARTGGY